MKHQNHFEYTRERVNGYAGRKVGVEELFYFCEQSAGDCIAAGDPDNAASAHITTASFIEEGRQVFSIGPVMQKMLAATEFSSVYASDVKPPYKCFYVDLSGQEKAAHSVSGFYVLSVPLKGPNLPKPYDKTPFNGGLIITAWSRVNKVEYIYNFTGHEMISEPLAKLEDTLEGKMKNCPDHDLGWKAILRIAVNLMLYLSNTKAEVVLDELSAYSADKVDERESQLKHLSPSKKEKVLTKISKKGACRVRYVAPAVEESMGGNIPRHWVRGHWHTYWVGKGRETKKLRWVMPYEKCTDRPEQQGVRRYGIEE